MKIKKIFAFVGEDSNGNESIISAKFKNENFPMVFSDPDLCSALLKDAVRISKEHNITAKLLKFSDREEMVINEKESKIEIVSN